jgi:hypothetical protein
LAESAFWHLTLYELDLLAVRHRRQQEREDRRACVAAWILVNVNRDSSKKAEPFRLEDVVAWLGHGFQRAPGVPQSVEPATPEELKQKLDVVHLLHKGLYGENGPQSSEE